MGKTSFTALLYREWLLLRKSIIVALISFVGITLLFILIALSLEYGNLKLLENMEGTGDEIIESIRISVRYFPLAAVGTMCLGFAEMAVNDVKPQWEHFRHSTPVSCFRFALAKYISVTVVITVSYGLAILSTFIMNGVLKSTTTAGDIATAVIVSSAFACLSILAQTLVFIFKSLDKAMLTTMGIMFAIIMPVVIVNGSDSKDVSSSEVIAGINSFCADSLPIAVAVSAIFIVLGFVLTVFIYKRREK